MNARTLLLTLSVLLISTLALAEEDMGDRVRITPMVGHVTFDATPPWNSIDATVFYGGSVGVKVNRWFGVNTYLGYAFANGNFGWAEDGSGGFVPTDNGGTDVDVMAFGFDFSFHPLKGRLDPWVMAGWTMLSYDYKFDTTAFGDWLSENDATWQLGDLKNAAGWQFGIGCAYAFRKTDHTSWSIVADFRDLMVKSQNLEIIDASGATVLEGEWGHNFVFNLGFEFSWGNYPLPAEEPERPVSAEG